MKPDKRYVRLTALHSLLSSPFVSTLLWRTVSDITLQLEWMNRSSRHTIWALAQVANPRESRVTFKVPRWLLRFALHSLSQDPPPPVPVITASLSIIAIDLGCDISNANDSVSERYADAPT